MLRKAMILVLASSFLLCSCVSEVNTLVTLASAAGKLMQNPEDPPIGNLTAAELQVIANGLPELAAQYPELGIPADQLQNAPQITAQQAADIVAFLDQEGITYVSDLQTLAEQVANGERELNIPDSLIQLAESIIGEEINIE